MGSFPIFIFGVLVIAIGIAAWRFLKHPVRTSIDETYYIDANGAEVPRDRMNYDQRERSRKVVTEEPSSYARYAPLALFGSVASGALLVIVSLVRIVSANTVAIPTNFGSIGKPVDPGLHLTLPWTEYHSFSTRIQESQRLSASNEGDKEASDCVTIAASDGADACVDATIRYTIDRSRADELYRRYGSFDAVSSKLVRREVEAGLKLVYGQYSPEEAKSGATLSKIERDGNAILRERMNRYGVVVDRVVLGRVQFTDPAVQKRIDDKIKARQEAEKAVIEQKTALTRAETKRKTAEINAKAKQINAQADADANAKLAASLTPELLQKLYYEALGKSGKVIVTNGAQTPVIVGGN